MTRPSKAPRRTPSPLPITAQNQQPHTSRNRRPSRSPPGPTLGLVENLRLRNKAPAIGLHHVARATAHQQASRSPRERGYEVRDEPSAGHNQPAPSARNRQICPATLVSARRGTQPGCVESFLMREAGRGLVTAEVFAACSKPLSETRLAAEQSLWSVWVPGVWKSYARVSRATSRSSET